MTLSEGERDELRLGGGGGGAGVECGMVWWKEGKRVCVNGVWVKRGVGK